MQSLHKYQSQKRDRFEWANTEHSKQNTLLVKKICWTKICHIGKFHSGHWDMWTRFKIKMNMFFFLSSHTQIIVYSATISQRHVHKPREMIPASTDLKFSGNPFATASNTLLGKHTCFQSETSCWAQQWASVSVLAKLFFLKKKTKTLFATSARGAMSQNTWKMTNAALLLLSAKLLTPWVFG